MAEIEKYRTEHESSVEWNLRRAFLEAHQEKYSEDRLICLASCFINVECYGCTYPGPVMIELKQLMEEISDTLNDYRSTAKNRTVEVISNFVL